MNEIKQYKNARFANRMQRKAEQPLPESALSAACVCKSQLTGLDGKHGVTTQLRPIYVKQFFQICPINPPRMEGLGECSQYKTRYTISCNT